MKAYLLKDEDFKKLLAEIDRDPRWGSQRGSSMTLNEEQRRAHDDAHRFFNYVVRRWIDEVKE